MCHYVTYTVKHKGSLFHIILNRTFYITSIYTFVTSKNQSFMVPNWFIIHTRDNYFHIFCVNLRSLVLLISTRFVKKIYLFSTIRKYRSLLF